jgi:hypothetical protein
MTTQREFWSDTGPESEGGETCGRFLPTPTGSMGEVYSEATTNHDTIKRFREAGVYRDGPLTLSAEASHAPIFLTLEKVPDLTENSQDCGGSLPVSFASWDQNTLSWRTCQRCLLGGLMQFSGRWPRSGTMRGGIVFRLPPLVPRISGTGCSLWPTPQTTDKTLCALRPGYQRKDNHSVGSLSEALMRNQPKDKPGSLNPQFVSWMMNFPLDWCDMPDELPPESPTEPTSSDASGMQLSQPLPSTSDG